MLEGRRTPGCGRGAPDGAPRGASVGPCILRLARGLAVAGGLAAAACGGAAGAAEGEAVAMAFDIPAQPLASALEAYSMASGVQVLYDSRLAVARRSAAVQGFYLPEAALRQLLKGTGLVERYTAARDVVITAPGVEGAANSAKEAEKVAVMAGVFALDTLKVKADPVARQDYRLYAGIVQTDLQKLLQADKRTRKGRYRVGIKLWVGQEGRVLRLEVFKSSGDRERDEAISRVLANVALSEEPPANMPQPIRVMISAWPV